jgi:hypothetical protein
MSTWPYFSKYSAVWKSEGSFWRIVCSIPLLPAKPILAPCSAMMISPSVPKLAVMPPKVGYVNADLTFKFTTEMEYEERWFSSRGSSGGGGWDDYSMSTFESVSGQTSGSIVKQAYLDGKLYYVNDGNIYNDGDGGGGSSGPSIYNASTSSQSSGWDGIIV